MFSVFELLVEHLSRDFALPDFTQVCHLSLDRIPSMASVHFADGKRAV